MTLPVQITTSLARVQIARTDLAEKRRLVLLGQASCRRGCANCCSYPLRISLWEGVLLYNHLVFENRWSVGLHEDLLGHARLTTEADPALLYLTNTPCPLLTQDKSCLGYGSRPLACRVTVSLGDPEDCHVHKQGVKNTVNASLELGVLAHLESHLCSQEQVSRRMYPISLAVLLAHEIHLGHTDFRDAHSLVPSLLEPKK